MIRPKQKCYYIELDLESVLPIFDEGKLWVNYCQLIDFWVSQCLLFIHHFPSMRRKTRKWIYIGWLQSQIAVSWNTPTACYWVSKWFPYVSVCVWNRHHFSMSPIRSIVLGNNRKINAVLVYPFFITWVQWFWGWNFLAFQAYMGTECNSNTRYQRHGECVFVCALERKHIRMKMKMKKKHANVRMQSNLRSIGLHTLLLQHFTFNLVEILKLNWLYGTRIVTAITVMVCGIRFELPVKTYRTLDMLKIK